MEKSELKQYRMLLKEAEGLRQRAEEFEEKIKSLRAVIIDGMPKKQGIKDNIGEMIAKLDNIRQQYIEKNNLMVRELIKIECAINKLNISTERILIRKRYIDGKMWEDIANDMGYSLRQIHRLHSSALINLKKMKK